MKYRIPFNIPYQGLEEKSNLLNLLEKKYISGNYDFTQRVHAFFEKKYGFRKTLMTTSCTDALEMSAILSDIGPGDEVLVPSYTFVSSALAFVRQGAKINFVDSLPYHPNMDVEALEEKITEKTRAIVVVHYGGVAVDMDKVMYLANKYNLYVIEDAAQAIDAYYKGKPLGGIGHFGTFSFHETKNIHCGEGGLLIVNDQRAAERAEIIWEKGTNRSKFFRGEINKYEWVDMGSSFLPDEMNAAFLLGQLHNLEEIQRKRLAIWNFYYENLFDWANINNVELPVIPEYATNNAHLFYLVMPSASQQKKMLEYLKSKGIHAVFHYMALHNSPYARRNFGSQGAFPNADKFTNRLIRLPLYPDLRKEEQRYIIDTILAFND